MKGGNYNFYSKYDLFISHASEDKDSLARPLAKSLLAKGYNVFLDELSIKMGDSISKRIGVGLSEARYYVIILSQAFFQKKWTNAELDAITNISISSQNKVLPIWHNITHENVMCSAPLLSDIRAANSSDGIENLVGQIIEVAGVPPKHMGIRTNFIWGFSDFSEAIQISILKNITALALDVDHHDYHDSLEQTALFLNSISIDMKQMSEKAKCVYHDAIAKIERLLDEDSIDLINDH